MIYSKNYSITAAALILSLGALPGCSSKVPAGAEIDHATFVVDRISATSSTQRATNPEWPLADTYIATLQACFTDKAFLSSVKGQRFVVQGGEVDQLATSTTDKGCITWSEQIHYNPTELETYVTLERTFVPSGKGAQKGAQKVSLGVNPWKGDVIDLRYSNPPNVVPPGEASTNALMGTPSTTSAVLSALTSGGASGEAHLLLDGVTSSFHNYAMTASPSGEKATVEFYLGMKPQMQVKSLENGLKTIPLNSANFLISFSIVENRKLNNGGMKKTVLASVDRAKIHMARGMIEETFNLELSRPLVPDYINKLVIRLEPVKGPQGLQPELVVADFNANSGSASNLTHVKGDYADFVKTESKVGKDGQVAIESEAEIATTSSCSDGHTKSGFYFQKWAISPANVSETTPDENVPSSKNLLIETCLASARDNSPISNVAFEGTLLDENGKASLAGTALRPDANGCIKWTDHQAYDYFGKGHWINRTIQIRGLEAPYQNIVRTVVAPINPWQLGGTPFMWNCLYGEAPKLNAKSNAKLELVNVGYKFQGRDFEIDKYLDLTFNRKFQFTLNPSIVRYDEYGNTQSIESLKNGRFKLRLLVTEDPTSTGDLNRDLNSLKYVSSYEHEVEARAGQINEEVVLPFDFQDLPRTADRNILFVELSSISNPSLLPVTVRAPFVPYTSGDASGTILHPAKIEEITRRAVQASVNVADLVESGRTKLLKRGWKMEPIALFDKATGLRPLLDGDMANLGLNAAEIENLIATGKGSKDLGSKLCSKIFVSVAGATEAESQQTAKELKRCTSYPSSYITIEPTKHVVKVYGRPREKASAFDMISLSSGLSRDRNKGESTSTGYSTSFGASMKVSPPVIGELLKWLGLDVGWSAGASWSYGWSKHHGSGQSTSVSMSMGKSIMVDKVELEIDAETRSCVIARRKSQDGETQAVPADKQTGLHICSAQAKKEAVTESWYYLTQAFGDSPTVLRDTLSRIERPWASVIRGQMAYEMLRRTFEDKTKEYVLNVEHQNPALESTLQSVYEEYNRNYPLFTDGAFPSLVVEKPKP